MIFESWKRECFYTFFLYYIFIYISDIVRFIPRYNIIKYSEPFQRNIKSLYQNVSIVSL